MTGKRQDFLPYGKQDITDRDIEAVVRVLKGDYLTTGPAVLEFEEKLKQVTCADYALSCSSGTAALHLACLAIDLGPGDLVIVPAISFAATANAVLYTGADVIFADVDETCGLLRRSDMEGCLEGVTSEQRSRIKAVMPVNLAGQVAELSGIYELAQDQGWKVIIDSCHALGGTYEKGQQTVGNCRYGDMEIFSFHPVKTVAAGEGGAVTTNDKELGALITEFRSHGIVRDREQIKDAPWYYEMRRLGFNYRQSDIHAALGTSQISRLKSMIDKRRKLVAQYDSSLHQLFPIVSPTKRVEGSNPGWHLYQTLVDFKELGLSRAELMGKLADKNIGTQVHYIPIYDHPFYQEKYGTVFLPGAASFYEKILSLPLHTGMDIDDVEYVCEILAECTKKG